MRNQYVATLSVLVFLAMIASPKLEAESVFVIPPRLQMISDDVCVCSFNGNSTQQKVSFIFEAGQNSLARMNIGGQETTLLPSSTDEMCMLDRLGERCVKRFKAENFQVVIDVKATWVCPDAPGSDNCEVTELEGKLKLQSVDKRKVINIKGVCAC
jgi:hypothetical protein